MSIRSMTASLIAFPIRIGRHLQRGARVSPTPREPPAFPKAVRHRSIAARIASPPTLSFPMQQLRA